MATFIIGLFVGVMLAGVVYSVVVLSKLHSAILLIQQGVTAQATVTQLVLGKLNKIDKTSEATMGAAETFIEALRESAENMQVMGFRPPRGRGQLPTDGFDDLRKSFEDGIRDMEDEGPEESDDDQDEPNEPWKK